MRKLTILASMLVLGVVIAASLSIAKADESDWDCRLTFSAPVEIPGMVLPAGTYEFRRLDPDAPGCLLAVYDSRGRTLELVEANLIYRPKPTDNLVMNLKQRVPNCPEAVMSWFYPDQNYGMEFMYPNTTPAPTAIAKK